VTIVVARVQETGARARRCRTHRRSWRGKRFNRFQRPILAPSAPSPRSVAPTLDETRTPNTLVRRRAVSSLDSAKAAARFEKYCRVLHDNDPTVTAVTTEDYFPAPFGRPMGEALLGNTHVSSVTLDLTPLYTGPVGEKTLSSLTQFLRESKTLRTINLYQTDHSLYHARLGKLCTVLVKAVIQNHSVEHLTLDGVSCAPFVAQQTSCS
jgi:hypothetical protein